MKRIEAIIRKTKFEDVKEALLQSDINWFEYHNVHGIGQSREERIYRGVQYSTDVIERVALTIVCRDQFVDPTVKVILEVARTGEIGDGRIFVSDIIDTWSIRTGEHGDIVLRDKKLISNFKALLRKGIKTGIGIDMFNYRDADTNAKNTIKNLVEIAKNDKQILQKIKESNIRIQKLKQKFGIIK